MANAFFHSEHAGRVVVRWFAVAAFSAFSAGCGRPAAVSDGVAERVVIGADTVVVCDLNKIRDTIDLPLSELTAEKLRIVKLETRPEAFFKPSKTFVSENYIGVVGYEPASFKLFDGNGKFLNDIGTQGRGPNEYRNIYWAQIDECLSCRGKATGFWSSGSTGRRCRRYRCLADLRKGFSGRTPTRRFR